VTADRCTTGSLGRSRPLARILRSNRVFPVAWWLRPRDANGFLSPPQEGSG